MENNIILPCFRQLQSVPPSKCAKCMCNSGWSFYPSHHQFSMVRCGVNKLQITLLFKCIYNFALQKHFGLLILNRLCYVTSLKWLCSQKVHNFFCFCFISFIVVQQSPLFKFHQRISRVNALFCSVFVPIQLLPLIIPHQKMCRPNDGKQFLGLDSGQFYSITW